MMTSISYSPCFRIATVMSAGIPYNAMTGIAAKAATVTGFDSVPVAAMASSATAWQTAAATAASAIHLICWRTSRPPDR